MKERKSKRRKKEKRTNKARKCKRKERKEGFDVNVNVNVIQSFAILILCDLT